MRVPFFTPPPGKRFSGFDLWVYALFHRRWTKHFRDYPDVRKAFIEHMQGWDADRAEKRAALTLVKPTTNQPEKKYKRAS